jgi:ATPase subunit of ABC transporter with duplicated ATPase domains
MEEIWQLSSLGLQVFGGNYDVYAEQKRYESQALERQLSNLDKQQRQLVIQAQRNREKAQQRAAQGNKLRKSGSQATSLLDFQQDRATARSANRTKNQQRRQVHLETKQQALKARKESISQQKLYLADTANRSRHAVALFDAVLAFGRSKPINWQVRADEKVHLTGANGSGKSTLLKTLLGKLSLKQGSLQRSAPIYYLDQHFAVIVPQLSMLDNLLEQCDGMQAGEARTLLAGIDFRRESVFRLGGTLSGGEKMKLAMLIASHQPQQPLLLLDEPDNHLDLDSKIILAQALYDYRGGFILVSHDDDFATDSGVKRQIEL